MENDDAETNSENKEILDVNGILDIDDKEYEIPTTTELPSLESILNEPDDTDFVYGLEYVGETSSDVHSVGGDSASLLNVETDSASPQRRRNLRQSIRYQRHGSVLRNVVLKGISAQVFSATDKGAGFPTAMAVSSFVAVGTSHGIVMVFDPKQVLKWLLGSSSNGKEYGAISALSINTNSSRILCGFSRGQITMWNLTDGKLIRTITDAHPPGYGILQLEFTDDHALALCSDSSGSVYQLEMKRLLGVRSCDSKCIFSGSRGEVCVVKPLHLLPQIKGQAFSNIVALGTLSKIIVITIKPKLQVLMTYSLKGPPATLPLIAWQFVVIQVTERDRVIDPVLSFARDQNIYFFQLNETGPEEVKFIFLQKTLVPYRLLSLSWMNTRTIVTLDTSERAHVLDVKSGEELEVVDLSNFALTYSSSFFKGLATGGNVSKALACAGEVAFYQSHDVYMGQLLLLGQKSLHVLTLRSWEERIDFFVKKHQFLEALRLAWSFYDGSAKGVVGLTGSLTERQNTVKQKMLTLLQHLASQGRKSNSLSSKDYCQVVIPECIRFALKLGEPKILFDELYDTFHTEPTARTVFLENLEPYILNNQLHAMPPNVVQDMVTHFQSKNLLSNIEEFIVKLEVSSLDIHQVFVLCWTHGLYDAIIHVYNNGMQDYSTPLEEMLNILLPKMLSGQSFTYEDTNLGNRIIVYVGACLSGRAYPTGELPPGMSKKVTKSIFKVLTVLHSKNHTSEEPTFPYLRTLLLFDAKAFLNAFTLAFEEPHYCDSEGKEIKQRLVDILLQVMVKNASFSSKQISAFFTFLARQMARQDNSVLVSRSLFEQVLDHLCLYQEGAPDAAHEERQQALLELLQAGAMILIDDDRIISAAEYAKFHQVCYLLYEKKRMFDKILLSHINNQDRICNVFTFIHHIMGRTDVKRDEKEKVKAECLKHLPILIEVDPLETAQILISGFGNTLEDVTHFLQQEPESLFKILRVVLHPNPETGTSFYMEQQWDVRSSVHETYIRLLSMHHPDQVYHYLCVAEGYNMPEALQICQEVNLPFAKAFLLEKMSKMDEAYKVLFEEMTRQLSQLVSSSCNILENGMLSVSNTVLPLIALTNRYSTKIMEEHRKKLWFPILDLVLKTQRELSAEKSSDFRQIASSVLNKMTLHVSPAAILQKIIQDPAYSSGKFGDVKDLIMDMLATGEYENTLLRTCAHLVQYDLHTHLVECTKVARQAVKVTRDFCHICFLPLNQAGFKREDVLCFKCLHTYHSDCLDKLGFKNLRQSTTFSCVVCTKNKKPQKTKVSSIGPQAIDLPNLTADEQLLRCTSLDSQQLKALDGLKQLKHPSRLHMLSELAEAEKNAWRGLPSNTASNTIFHSQSFQLQLSAPLPKQADQLSNDY